MPTTAEYDLVFLNIAKEIASLSKCVSHQVGCVVVKDGRILSTGYNGTPAGYKNCNELFNSHLVKNNIRSREEHHMWSNLHEIHSELNAVSYAAKHGIALNGATMYCTLEPCANCAKTIIQAGIVRVVFGKFYDKSTGFDKTQTFYSDCGVDIQHVPC